MFHISIISSVESIFFLMQFSKLTPNIKCKLLCDTLGHLKEVQDLLLLKVNPEKGGQRVFQLHLWCGRCSVI